MENTTCERTLPGHNKTRAVKAKQIIKAVQDVNPEQLFFCVKVDIIFN